MNKKSTVLPVKHLKVIIFDCDGVMFDSTAANTNYYSRILRRFNRPEMTAAQLAYVHMHTADEAIAYLFPDKKSFEAAQAYRRELGYLPFIKYMTISPGLVTLLKRIKTRYHTAIATNRTDTMQRVLTDHDLEKWFDYVVTAMDVAKPKPHPDQLLKIMAHFKIKRHQSVFIGDSELDALAAQAAGIAFIAYRNSGLSADLHIDSFIDLEKAIASED